MNGCEGNIWASKGVRAGLGVIIVMFVVVYWST